MKKINFLLVLFSLYIFSSCENPAGPSKPQPPSIPKGKGAFTLVISDINGRTILPTSPTLSSFPEFKFEFFKLDPGGSSTPLDPVTRTYADRTKAFILDVGKYKLQVTAYLSAGDGKPAAYGEIPEIEIKEGQTNTGSLSLKAIGDKGTGTFRWNITLPSGTTEASMTITPLDTTKGTPAQTLYFIGGTPVIQKQDSCVLNSGYYNVLITLIKDDETQKIERRDILHIYQNLESVFTLTSSNWYDFTKKNYKVTFFYNNGLANGIQTYYLDEKITEPDPERDGYVFDGWYKEETLDNKWNVTTDTVEGDMPLYAKWMPAGTFNIEFTITNQLQIVDSKITMYPGWTGYNTATIKVKNADDFSDINWYYNDESGSLGSDGTFTLDSSVLLGSIGGYRFITVKAVKADDGALYSALVMVKVQIPAAKIGTKPYETLFDAINDVPITGTAVDNPTEIVLLTNVTAPETGTTMTGGYNIKTGQHIKITVETDCYPSINSSAGGFALFTVNSPATTTSVSSASLTLDGSKGSLTLSGGGLAATANRRGIYINNGGTVAINDNVYIAGFRNSTSSSYYGGGLYMTGANARFTMNGGKIYGNGSDVPEESLKNTAYSTTAAIYVGNSGTAVYGGRYERPSGSSNSISSTSDTLPTLGTITISPSGSNILINTKLYAIYSGNETVSYRWSNGDTTPWCIPATTGTYTVTVSAPGYTSKPSSSVTINTGDLAGKIIINPKGQIQKGTILTASYDGSEPETNNVTINYQWRQETNSSIPNSNTSVYTPTESGIYNLTLSATGYYSKSSGTGDIVAYILPAPSTIHQLNNGLWTDGEFKDNDSAQQDWYYIDVSPGTEYHVWLNHVNFDYGDGVKTATSRVSIIYEDGELVCLDQNYYYTWDSYVTIKSASNSSSKVYIQVKPYSSSVGTYGIVYSTGTERPKNNTLNPSAKPAQQLTENSWKDGTLGSASSQDWYFINADSDATYYVWWNERTSYLSNTKGGVTLAEVDVTAWYSDGSEAFANSDTSWWPAPKSFTAKAGERITLQIRPRGASSSYTGDYQIVYSKNSAKPDGNQGDWTAPASFVTLTDGTWGANRTLSTTSQQDWYSFEVTAGTTYYVWCYDYSYSSSTSNASVTLGGCYGNNGEVFFYDKNNMGSSAQPFTAIYSGTVYIRAKYYSRTGSYRVAFSTSSTRP